MCACPERAQRSWAGHATWQTSSRASRARSGWQRRPGARREGCCNFTFNKTDPFQTLSLLQRPQPWRQPCLRSPLGARGICTLTPPRASWRLQASDTSNHKELKVAVPTIPPGANHSTRCQPFHPVPTIRQQNCDRRFSATPPAPTPPLPSHHQCQTMRTSAADHIHRQRTQFVVLFGAPAVLIVIPLPLAATQAGEVVERLRGVGRYAWWWDGRHPTRARPSRVRTRSAGEIQSWGQGNAPIARSLRHSRQQSMPAAAALPHAHLCLRRVVHLFTAVAAFATAVHVLQRLGTQIVALLLCQQAAPLRLPQVAEEVEGLGGW
jgi:hypothetical protein